MVKPNTTFKLSIRDIEIIEIALRAKAGRRGLAIANGETSQQLKEKKCMRYKNYWDASTIKRLFTVKCQTINPM